MKVYLSMALSWMLTAGCLAAPVAGTWPTPGNADASAVASAALAGVTAAASTASDTVEVRDAAQNLLRIVTRAQMQALLPWMALDASPNGPSGLALSDSGRLLFIAVTDTTTAGDGLPSDAILRLDVDTGDLRLFHRAELGGTDASNPRVAMTHYKGRLYVGVNGGSVVMLRAIMNDLASTTLFTSPAFASGDVTGLAVDRGSNGLLVATATEIHRAPITTASSLTFTLRGSRSNIRAIAFSEHYGGLLNSGLYVLEGTTSHVLSFASLSAVRGTGTLSFTSYTSGSGIPHDLAASVLGQLIVGRAAGATLLTDSNDTRLAYPAFVRSEFDQVVAFGRGLISPDGQPPGWVIDADVLPGANRLHPATPDAAAWTVLLLLMNDEVNRLGGGGGDPQAQAQVRTILDRYAGLAPDGITPLRSADGIYWHWINPATGGDAGWGDGYSTMSTMKIVLAAARAMQHYPADYRIRRAARAIICNVHNWDAYFQSVTPRRMYLNALAGGGANTATGSGPYHEGILFSHAAGAYGGANSINAHNAWLNRATSPSAALLTARPVTGDVSGQFQAAFTSLYPLLLIPEYRSSASWQAQVRDLRASNAAWTDDNGPQYSTVFSAGTSYINGYNADSLSNHPGDITTFTSLLAFAAGDGASGGRHVEAGGAYEAYRMGARQTFKTGASILYRRSNALRTYAPDSAGLPDVALGALGLAELLDPGIVARVLTGSLPACSYCEADLDDGNGLGIIDGGVDINDLIFFLDRFELGDLAADLDDDGLDPPAPDGGVDINDLLFFLGHFEIGC